MTARPSQVIDEVEDLALTKADIRNPDRLMDVLTVFALEYPEEATASTASSSGGATNTTTASAGGGSSGSNGNVQEEDIYKWVNDATQFVKNSGMKTAEHLLDAIRTNRKLENPSNPQIKMSTVFDESPLSLASTRSALNQFLSRIDSDLYDPDSFHLVLREFLLLYYSATSRQEQHLYPMSTRQVGPSSSGSRGNGNGSGVSVHEKERAEIWKKSTEQSLEWVKWLKKVHIETACQLRTAIQQGTLNAKLNSITMPSNLPRLNNSSDVIQSQLVQFLLPIATPLNWLRQDGSDGSSSSSPKVKRRPSKGATQQQTMMSPSSLLSRSRRLSTFSFSRATSSRHSIVVDGGGSSSSNNHITIITEQEMREYSYLLGMANPEQAHLTLYDIYLQQQLLKDEDTNSNIPSGGSSNNNINNNQQQQQLSPIQSPQQVQQQQQQQQNQGLVPAREFYTYEERERFKVRPLMSRLFVTIGFVSTEDHDMDDPNQVNGWLRSRFSDREDNDTYLQQYCQYFMEAHSNQAGAVVATVSDLMLRYYELDRNEYCSEACKLASALCNSAQNTHFGIHPRLMEYFTKDELYENEGYFDTETLRFRFVDYMSHIFRAIAKHRFLNDNSNTYRLAHCLTDGSFDKTPLWVPTFSFLLQVCLIVYVILELVEVVKGGGEEFIVLSYDMVALGVFTSIYSAIQARNGLQQSLSVLNVYEQMDGPRDSFPGLLALLDIFVNIVMPIVVVFAGFLVVAVQDNYIEGVLNCAALLFIPEIDDELPAYFNWNTEEIVQAYIVRKVADEVVSKMNFNSLASRRRRASYIRAGVMPSSGGENIEFSDIVITNSRSDQEEEGCTPYEIRPAIDTYGIVSDETDYFVHHERQPEKVYITSSITSDCLLKEVKWRYVRDTNLNKGFVERLYLKKLSGEEVLLHQDDSTDDHFFESSSTSRSTNIGRTASIGLLGGGPNGDTQDDWDGEVRGVFIITNFDRDRLITSLRICGSNQNDDEKELKHARKCFKQAMDYYSLWDLAESAESVLAGSLIRKSTTKSLSLYNKFAKMLLEYNVLGDYDTYRWQRLNREYDDLIAGNSPSTEMRSWFCPWRGRRS